MKRDTRAKTKKARPAAKLLIALAGLLPALSQAQEDADGWQWRASIYGWLPSISGATQFPGGGTGPSIDVDADTILDSLNFTFMGALDVQKGAWGMFTDVLYLDVDGSKSSSRDFTVGGEELPAGIDLNASLDLKSLLWTIAGTYGLSMTSGNSAEVLLGARMFKMDQTLDWTFNGDIAGQPLPGRSGRDEAEATLWDAIIGLKGYAALGEGGKWFIPYHFDVGTGDSDLTWQAMAGLGYAFGWGKTVLTWRHLDYDLESGVPIQDLEFSGPLIGASFEW